MARTMPRLTFIDGTQTDLPEGEPVGSVLPLEAIAARVDGELRDLSFVPTADATVDAVEASDDDGLHVLRHSTAHVMAQAVCDLHPGAKYAIGPAIEDGFYYDIELPEPLSSDDLPAIEARMRELVAADVPFIREEVARADAFQRFADQPYKVEIIQGLGDEGVEGEAGGGDAVTLVSGTTCPRSQPIENVAVNEIVFVGIEIVGAEILTAPIEIRFTQVDAGRFAATRCGCAHIAPRAIVRKAAVTAPARMPNARTRRVRRVTGRRSADRAAMAAATAMAVVAASAAAVVVAAALPEGSA
jgi:hypothetical protein